MLNHLARGASGRADRIHLVLKESSETRSLSDTEGIGDTIGIQYCLTEGKHLDDGQINL